jgi:hypothetical protein
MKSPLFNVQNVLHQEDVMISKEDFVKIETLAVQGVYQADCNAPLKLESLLRERIAGNSHDKQQEAQAHS